MKKEELIFVPGPGFGHLASGLELAKRLLDHDDRLSITALVMNVPFIPSINSYTRSLAASQPHIKLVDLPQVDPPPPELLTISPEAYICDFVESYIPHVKTTVTDIISSLSNSDVRVAGFIVDFFCVSMIDIANEFSLPPYIFVTSNAGFLGLMLNLPKRHDEISEVMQMSDPDSLVPGFFNPVPARVFPDAVFNKHGGYAAYVKVAQRFKDGKGIIVNTFAELEPFVLRSFSDDHRIPPVYPVGPVLHLKGQPHPEINQDQLDKIMKWLDEQPQSSVVFLCFGSFGSFSPPQVKEIALGIEQSGFRFLWSMRFPHSPSNQFMNPEDVLPEGFLERIEGRGIMCGWAPQGVPIVTLPIYAEQQLNAFTMVKELGLSVELKLDSRVGGDLVTADEMAKSVICVMQSDSEVRKKVKEMSEKGRKAVMDGGSSFTSITQLIQDITGNN
ncbi:UDP-glycosyltransferase 71K1-like [Populus alba x Populus x berolinensis]|uniref:UDP-glycosyltransferase 71K1-like n=1 Tax=Populus alba x Populus x berolinensis TaxID=444605 RepID=A0AAD6MFH7_9ROSI|nr:UDP-glycosyltransferase 71K1-like [Populus alba x Populus x berolinensis]